jgi:hypothetical protein
MYTKTNNEKYIDKRGSPTRLNEKYISRSPRESNLYSNDSEREIYIDGFNKRNRSNSPRDSAITNPEHRKRKSILVPLDEKAYEIDKEKANIPYIKLGYNNKRESSRYAPQGSPKNVNMQYDYYQCNDRTFITNKGMNEHNDIILSQTPSRKDPGEYSEQRSPRYQDNEYNLNSYRKNYNYDNDIIFQRSSKYILSDTRMRSPTRMTDTTSGEPSYRKSNNQILYDPNGDAIKRSPGRSRDVVYVEEKRYYIQEEPDADDTIYLMLKNAITHAEKTSRLNMLRSYFQRWKKYDYQMTIGFLNSELRRKPKEIIKEVIQIKEIPIITKEIVEVPVIQEIPIIQEKIIHIEKNIGNLNVVRLAAAKLILKTILKRRFEKLRNKLARLPNKKLREKLLKKLLKYTKRGHEAITRECFSYWKDGTNRFNFKKSKLAKSISHSTKSLKRRILSKCFNKWRRIAAEKDTTLYFKGFSLFQKFLKRKAYNKIMPLNSIEGIKKRSLAGLCANADKIIHLVFKIYIRKWKENIFQKLSNKQKGTLLKNLSWTVLKRILAGRFMKWKRLLEWEKAMKKLDVAESQKKKVYGAMKLNDAITKSAKKNFLKAMLQPVHEFVDKEVKKKACRKIVNNICPKINKLLLRGAFKRLRNKVIKLKADDSRINIFQTLIRNLYFKILRRFIRKRFNKWVKFANKDNTWKIVNGYNFLRLFVMRQLKIVNKKALKNIVDKKYSKKTLIKAFKLTDLFTKKAFRSLFIRWKRNTSKIMLKANSESLSMKLFNSSLHKLKKRLLTKRFNQWRRKPDINIGSIYARNKIFCENLRKYVLNTILKPLRFFYFLNLYKSLRKIKSALSMFAGIAENSTKARLKLNFLKWERRARLLTASIAKGKIIKNMLLQQYHKSNRSGLGAAMHHWKLKCYMLCARDRSMDLLKLNINIFKGLDILIQFYRSRYVKFWSNFRTKTSVTKNVILADGRGNLLYHLYKKFEHPKGTKAGCFGRWRYLVMEEVKALQLRLMANKRLGAQIKAVVNRFTRERVLKCFEKWRLISKGEVNYLVVTKLFDTITKFANMFTKEAFYKIMNYKNYRKLVDTLFPMTNKLKTRNDKKCIAKRFNQLRDLCRSDRITGFRALIFSKLDRIFVNRLKNAKLRYFLKWKLKGYDVAKASEGWRKLSMFCKRTYLRKIDNLYKNICLMKMKRKSLFILMSKQPRHLKHVLRLNFNHWHKYTLATKDQGYIFSKNLRALKRIIQEKMINALLKTKFQKWKLWLIKGPDIIRYNQGYKYLENFVKRQTYKNPLYALYNVWFSEYSESCLKSLFPYKERLNKKALHFMFNKWKRITSMLKLITANFRLLVSQYSKGKNAVSYRTISKYFKKWAYRKIPIDLKKVIQAERTLFSLWCRMYMNGFFDLFAQNAKFKFCRSLLTKTSKYHKRNLSIFFLRWAKMMYFIRDAERQNELKSTIFTRTLKISSSSNLLKIVKKKFSQWRGYVNSMNKVCDKIMPFSDKLKRFALMNIACEPLQAFMDYNNKCIKMQRLTKIGFKIFMRKLIVAFMRWRTKLGLFKIDHYQNKLKRKVLNTLFLKSDNMRKLRAFITWRDTKQIRSVYFEVGVNLLKKSMRRQLLPVCIYRIKLFSLKGRLIDIIKQFYNKSQEITKICFNHWRKNTAALTDHLNAKVVQNFIKDVQNKKSVITRNKKWAGWINNLNIIWLLVTNAINKKTLNVLKYEARLNKFFIFLMYLEYMNKNIIYEAFEKLKQFGIKLTNKKNICARKIQKNVRGHIAKKNIWFVIKKLRRLRNILILMGNKNLRYTAIAFEFWRKHTKSYALVKSAEVIQNFIKKSVIAKKLNEKQTAFNFLRCIFEKYFRKAFLSVLKTTSNYYKFNKLADNIYKYYQRRFLNNFSYLYKMNIFSKVFKIPNSLALRILRERISRWHQIAKYLNFLENKESIINKSLTALVSKHSQRTEDINKYYLTVWLRKCQRLKVTESASVIYNFVQDGLKKFTIRKKWMKLIIGLSLLKYKLNSLEIIRKVKLLKALNLLGNNFRRNILINSWQMFTFNIKNNKISRILLGIFKNFENRYKICYLFWSFTKWIRYISFHRMRYRAVVKMVNTIHHRRLIADTYFLNNAFMVKRLIRMVYMIRAKYVFDIMKHKASKERYQVMLISKLRKNFIASLKGYLKESSRIMKMVNVIRLCQKHKSIAVRKYRKEILKRWKFVVVLNQIAKQKMEAIYSKIQDTYMNMASELIENEEEALLAELEKVDDGGKVDYNELLKKTNINDMKTKIVFDLETGTVLCEDDKEKNKKK